MLREEAHPEGVPGQHVEYIFEKEVLQYCHENKDLAQDVIPALIRDQKPVFGHLTSNRHYDIGTFKILEEVRVLIEEGKQLFGSSS